MPSGTRPVAAIPDETYREAHRIYNIQHVYVRIGDQLETILAALNLVLLDPTSIQNPDTTLRLALTTSFQFAEGFHDRAAADATMKRLDWKYALYLPVKHAGIHEPHLCEYRQKLYSSPSGLQQFAILLDQLTRFGLYSKWAGDPGDPVCALSSVCMVTRLYRLNQAMKSALSMLVAVSPDWLRANAQPHWYERYKTGRINQSLDPARTDLPQEIKTLGADISRLLNTLLQNGSPELTGQAEIRYLARLMDEQYSNQNEGMCWREAGCSSCAKHNRATFHQ